MLSFELQAHLNKHSTRMSDLGFVSGLEDLKKKSCDLIYLHCATYYFVFTGSVPWLEFESQSGSYISVALVPKYKRSKNPHVITKNELNTECY